MRHAMMLVAGASLPLPALAMAGAENNRFFSPAQLDLLAAYADALIPETDTPGAIGAGVPRAVDAMMRDWASDETRAGFVSVLEALDAAARDTTGSALAALPPARRIEVVKAFDTARIAEQQAAAHPTQSKDEPVDRADEIASQKALEGQEKSSAGARLAKAAPADEGKPANAAGDPVASLAGPYGRLKDLVMTTYYLSEPGATQELRYELIPGEWNAELPLGDDQRAWAV